MALSKGISGKGLLRRISIPWIAVFVGLGCGAIVWVVLDAVQPRAVQRALQGEVQVQLEQKARAAMFRFHNHLQAHASTVRLLAHNRRLAAYLEPILWRPQDAPDLEFHFDRPPWLPPLERWSSLVKPGYVILVDKFSQAREVYHISYAPLPPSLEDSSALQAPPPQNQYRLATLDGEPFLFVCEAMEDASGTPMGHIMMATRLDEAFLKTSQQSIDTSGLVVGLMDESQQLFLATSNPEALPAGTDLDQARENYFVTVQSFAEYNGLDLNMVFVTLIPNRVMEQATQRVMALDRQQRLITSLAFITAFTLVIFLISAQIDRMLKRISVFARRVLGFEQTIGAGGNQLYQLEDWVWQFIRTTRRSRDEMQKRYSSEIREGERIKRAIMEAALDAIITTDGGGGIVEYNITAQNLFGFTRQAVIGRALDQLMVEAGSRGHFRDLLHASVQTAAPTMPPQAVEMTGQRADGSLFPAEVSIKPIDLGDRTLFTVYLHDITERKRREHEMRLLAKFPGESPTPMLRLDHRGLIIYANLASEPLLDYWGAAVGRSMPPFWQQRLDDIYASGRHHEIEVECDQRIYSLLLNPIKEWGYLNIYGREITKEREAEQKAREHQQELVHVCRLSTMGEMSTGLAHELNQPLAAITNFANGCIRRLQADSGEGERIIDALRQIAKQADRAGAIIRHLRSLVGKTRPRRGEADLNEVVREVCSFTQFQARKADVAVVQELWDAPVAARIDLVQIEQVLLNLMLNSLDALHEVDVDRRSLHVSTGCLDEETLFVAVQDTGPGIDPRSMDRLFDAFFSTKDSGMGMGLAISRNIVEDHQGKIKVESEVGKGARFEVILPRVHPTSAASSADPSLKTGTR